MRAAAFSVTFGELLISSLAQTDAPRKAVHRKGHHHAGRISCQDFGRACGLSVDAENDPTLNVAVRFSLLLLVIEDHWLNTQRTTASSILERLAIRFNFKQ
jgi:hypothetical protein